MKMPRTTGTNGTNRYQKLVVADTQSDSIQCLNFAKKDSFNIRFNIALPKIQFKILFN